MATLRFDFGTEYNLSAAKELERKIDLVLKPFGYSYSDLFAIIFPHIDGWYVSSPNINRELKDFTTENGRTIKHLNNVFFRPRFDSMMEPVFYNTGFIIKGNIEYSIDNRGYVSNKVNVKEFLISKNQNRNLFEKEITSTNDFRNLQKEHFTYNNNSIQNALGDDFLITIPRIFNQQKLASFVEKWKEYLEFERAVFISRMKAMEIRDWKLITLVEIPKTPENKDEFENDIYHQNDHHLYINSLNRKLKSNENEYTLLEFEIEMPQDGNEKETKGFVNGDISIINKKDAIELDNQKNENNIDKEIKSQQLGDLLRFKKKEKENPNNNIFTVTKFLPEASNSEVSEIENLEKKIIKNYGTMPYIANIAAGDIALYKRGKAALDDLLEGNVKNPLIAGYLIEPDRFEESTAEFNANNIDFALKNLNLIQKNTIIQCLNSNSIFLIQGPPGTGKTQTITELVYQYNKMGKKVVLSSQTHLAIDNVIERLPPDLNILPIRLVTDQRKANDKFLPDKLVDILYDSAEKKYSGKINDFETYGNKILKTEDDFNKMKSTFEKIAKKREQIAAKEHKFNNLNKERSDYSNKFNEIEIRIKSITNELKLHTDFQNNEFKIGIYHEFIELKSLYDSMYELSELHKISISDCKTANDILYTFNKIAGDSRINYLKETKQKLSEKPEELTKIENEIAEQLIYIEGMKKRGKQATEIDPEIKIMNQLLQRKKELEKNIGNGNSTTKKPELFFYNNRNVPFTVEILDKELKKIESFKSDFQKALAQVFSEEEYTERTHDLEDLKGKKAEFNRDFNMLNVELEKLKTEILELNAPIELEQKQIEKYFNDFFTDKVKLSNNSLPESDEIKFQQIQNFIKSEKIEYEKERKKYDQLSGIYQSIANHLKQKSEFIGRDRNTFTKDLFDNNANVFGITCTASPRYTENRNSYLKELGLGNIDIRSKDFDVVIIDEVSKATPIELLIPILYGKTVILVGDHRQLPPIFKYRDSNFEYLTPENKAEVLQGKSLEYFKKIVEKSLFEDLFTNVKKNKAILLKQYRSHEQIMNCVNVFYDGKLELGSGEDQNNKKQHNLDISIKSGNREIPIIIKNRHTYWFDSNNDAEGRVVYENQREGKTSFYNLLEAKITVKLIQLIDKAYGELKQKDNEAYKRAIGDSDDKMPSIGVISMYGEQVYHIKQEIRREHFKEKNITLKNSTVDDYQGQENDIIIVNFVRNNRRHDAGEFIKRFNRINVAISRARNMLIIVGSKEFCQELKVIVPDMEGNNQRTLKAYAEIYSKCQGRFNSAANLLNIKL